MSAVRHEEGISFMTLPGVFDSGALVDLFW